ncbi:MAG: ATPase superfamily-like protein [Gemmatimonadetes bacterium]|nr:ATPase superfamily-like protein [Gemmatimonadota bacterium]
METVERQRVRAALDNLKPFLRAFVLQRLPSSARKGSSADDIQGLLKLVLDQWNDVFAGVLPAVARSYLHELRDVRNRWAHEETFSGSEADRAVDTARQLAIAIGAPTPESSQPGHRRRGVAVAPRRAKVTSQRDKMRELYRTHGGNESRILDAYVRAENAGEVIRRGNRSNLSSEEYATALLRDGLRKGWIEE